LELIFAGNTASEKNPTIWRVYMYMKCPPALHNNLMFLKNRTRLVCRKWHALSDHTDARPLPVSASKAAFKAPSKTASEAARRIKLALAEVLPGFGRDVHQLIAQYSVTAHIYVFGGGCGYSGLEVTSTCERLDVTNMHAEWEAVPGMPEDRWGHQCFFHQGEAYVLGGQRQTRRTIASVCKLSWGEEGMEWTSLGQMNQVCICV
jgi:hypothetical protein